VTTEPTTPSPQLATTTVYERGPNLLVRFVWWLFIGWWASGIAVTVAWIALVRRTRRTTGLAARPCGGREPG
jgi:hypothetical protein